MRYVVDDAANSVTFDGPTTCVHCTLHFLEGIRGLRGVDYLRNFLEVHVRAGAQQVRGERGPGRAGYEGH
jgi:hypothetical protein